MDTKYSQEELDQLRQLLATQVARTYVSSASPRAEQATEPAHTATTRRALPKTMSHRSHHSVTAQRLKQQYEDIAATTGEIIILALWVTLWGLNAWFTVSFAAHFGISIAIALPIHFMCTTIELHLWRKYQPDYRVFIVLVTFIDLFSSAYELSLLLSTHLGTPAFDVWWVVGYTIGAVVIAILPEQQALKIAFSIIAQVQKKG